MNPSKCCIVQFIVQKLKVIIFEAMNYLRSEETRERERESYSGYSNGAGSFSESESFMYVFKAVKGHPSSFYF